MALPADADIPRILSRIRPAAAWSWHGNGSTFADPSHLEWADQTQTVPTLQELEAEWTAILNEETTKNSVRQQLKNEYAPLAGRSYSTLTNAELRTISEIHTYILGGIDEQTRLLKPANQWQAVKEILDAT